MADDLTEGDRSSIAACAGQYRIGAVARMARVPVATLRNWERRYRITDAATTSTGHRLYTAAEVQRVALLKQLVDMGHAIGSIAHVPDAELRKVACTHVQAMTLGRPARRHAPSWRVAIVGDVLQQTLRATEVMRRLSRRVTIVWSQSLLEQVVVTANPPRLDTLLLNLIHLDPVALQALQALRCALAARDVAVWYCFGTADDVQAFKSAGITLFRDSPDSATLQSTLQKLADAALEADDAAKATSVTFPVPEANAGVGSTAVPPYGDVLRAPPRKFDDVVLADLARLSSTMACECPKHVAELLARLTEFEIYSAECESLSPADAELHSWLHHVAGTARGLFEVALQRIAVREGLMQPD